MNKSRPYRSFWGDPSEFVPAAHAAGIAVLHQVGSVEAAVRAKHAGVDVIIAQGTEAGGHVAGEISTMVLLPRIVDAVAPTLVLAAGGIADARGLAAALCLGADGVVMGTRFIATLEANAHPVYKAQLVAASEEDTVRTILFGHGWPHAPHRTLRTRFVREWVDRESETQDSRSDEPVIGHTVIGGAEVPIQRFASLPPNIHATGEIQLMSLLAGQSVGLVDEIPPTWLLTHSTAKEIRIKCGTTRWLVPTVVFRFRYMPRSRCRTRQSCLKAFPR